MRRGRLAGVPRSDGANELAGADRLPRFACDVDFGAGGGLGDDLCSLTEMPDEAPTGSEVFRRLVFETTPETRNNTFMYNCHLTMRLKQPSGYF